MDSVDWKKIIIVSKTTLSDIAIFAFNHAAVQPIILVIIIVIIIIVDSVFVSKWLDRR